jgi:beta-N-acetylhexosaminidase
VTRDAGRHAWQEQTVAAAAALRPDLVVVETGVPGDRPEAGSVILTFGAGRANLEAAASALRAP